MGTEAARAETRCHVLVGSEQVDGSLAAAGVEATPISLEELQARARAAASSSGADPDGLRDLHVLVVPATTPNVLATLGEIHELGVPTVVAAAAPDAEHVLDFGRAGAGAVWDLDPRSFARSVDAALARQDTSSGVHRAQDRFRRLLRTIPAAVWKVDASRAYASLASAYGPESDLAASVDEATRLATVRALNDEATSFGPDVGEVIARALFDAWLGGDRTSRVEVSLQRSGSARTLVLSAAMPAPSEMHQVVVVGLDLTDRRELEKALLASQRLEAVGRLAAGIAHDFNNVLTVLATYTQFVFEDLPEASETRNDVETMQDAIRRASDLISQLLVFSRKREQLLDDVELNSAVRDVERLLRRTLGEDIAIRLALHEGELSLRADPTQIEQVLMNLAVNARDAMPRGGSLTIRTERRSRSSSGLHPGGLRIPPGAYAVLTVSDTGVGMDAEVAEHIFEPFFTTKDARGSGLGLATTYSIVKQHGGFIFVHTEVERGTTFEILLPLVLETRRSSLPVTRPSSAPRVKRTRVLLVEDDNAVRTALTRVLGARGLDVVAVSGADDALARLADESFAVDVLVTDLILPGLNGAQIAERARRLRPEIGVVMMSGYQEHDALATAFGDTRAKFVRKPASPEALELAIEESIHREG